MTYVGISNADDLRPLFQQLRDELLWFAKHPARVGNK